MAKAKPKTSSKPKPMGTKPSPKGKPKGKPKGGSCSCGGM